jgi:hypothetical protein
MAAPLMAIAFVVIIMVAMVVIAVGVVYRCWGGDGGLINHRRRAGWGRVSRRRVRRRRVGGWRRDGRRAAGRRAGRRHLSQLTQWRHRLRGGHIPRHLFNHLSLFLRRAR